MGMYLLISPVLKVNSLSSAASKSYRALTFLGSLAGVVLELRLVAPKFVEGYKEELPEEDLGDPDVSFKDNSIAFTIWSSSSCDCTTLGSLLRLTDFLAG